MYLLLYYYLLWQWYECWRAKSCFDAFWVRTNGKLCSKHELRLIKLIRSYSSWFKAMRPHIWKNIYNVRINRLCCALSSVKMRTANFGEWWVIIIIISSRRSDIRIGNLAVPGVYNISVGLYRRVLEYY